MRIYRRKLAYWHTKEKNQNPGIPIFRQILFFKTAYASDPKLFEKAVNHLADKLGVRPSDIDPDRIIKGKTVIYKVVPRDNLPLSIEKKLLSAPGGKELFLT